MSRQHLLPQKYALRDWVLILRYRPDPSSLLVLLLHIRHTISPFPVSLTSSPSTGLLYLTEMSFQHSYQLQH